MCDTELPENTENVTCRVTGVERITSHVLYLTALSKGLRYGLSQWPRLPWVVHVQQMQREESRAVLLNLGVRLHF